MVFIQKYLTHDYKKIILKGRGDEVILYLFYILLFMSICCPGPPAMTPAPGPFTAFLIITTLEFKQAMFDGYEKYKNLPSYLPSSAGVNKDVSSFGSKGATYRLCGEEISNIEDVRRANEELFYIGRITLI